MFDILLRCLALSMKEITSNPQKDDGVVVLIWSKQTVVGSVEEVCETVSDTIGEKLGDE